MRILDIATEIMMSNFGKRFTLAKRYSKDDKPPDRNMAEWKDGTYLGTASLAIVISPTDSPSTITNKMDK